MVGSSISSTSKLSKQASIRSVSSVGSVSITILQPQSINSTSSADAVNKPRSFDDNLALYFQEVGAMEEEKDVEEIFVSGQRSAVEDAIDIQRR